MRWSVSFRGLGCWRWYVLTMRRLATGAARWGWKSCCALTSCSSGSTCPTPGVEEAIYESSVLQRLVEVDLGAAPAPDETTICRFRHLLEKHALCGLMLETVNIHLEAKGIKIATGTIIDATIIHAPFFDQERKRGVSV